MARFNSFCVFLLLLLGLTGCQRVTQQQEVSALNATLPEVGVELLGEKTIEMPSLSDHAIELDAYWEPVEGEGMGALVNAGHDKRLTELKVHQPKRVYKGSDFSGFLPGKAVKIGQVWKVDEGVTSRFLSQFSAAVQEKFRRDGVGTYAMVRAYSNSHVDLLFRNHSQIWLTEQPQGLAPDTYTPAQFAGRIVIDRQTGKVEYFRVYVPTDETANVNFEMQCGEQYLVGMVFVPRMELVGGQSEVLQGHDWLESLEEKVARHRLAQEFFAFELIDWVPFDEALKRAKEKERPIFAVIIKGALNDQSC